MKLKIIYTTTLCLSGFVILLSFVINQQVPIKFVVPKGWPKPVYDFSKNNITADGFKLGNALFYDPVLSKDHTISCSSCHLSFTAFTHADHSLSHGIYGLKGTRNSIGLVNLAWSNSFMWDGRINNLETQALNPITSPVEMDSKMDEVLIRLNNTPRYRTLFFNAFKDSVITSDKLLKGLAQFTVMLESYNSKYDSVMRKEKNVSFSTTEKNGYHIFKLHCASCHTEPLFTNNSFQNNGLAPDSSLNDYGRIKITHKAADSLKFKVPTLRNIEFSAPYFHDGRFNKLKEAVEHYLTGIHQSPTLAKELQQKISLTPPQKKDLIAFLLTLTDKSFLYDNKFRYNFSD